MATNISDIGTLLSTVGTGMGSLLDAITIPLAILIIVLSVGYGIKQLLGSTFKGVGKHF